MAKFSSCKVVEGISDRSAVLLSLSNEILKRDGIFFVMLNFARVDDNSILDMLDLKYNKFLEPSCQSCFEVNKLWLRLKNTESLY